jgi:diguanylate cyclase (GGDEF)-like protein
LHEYLQTSLEALKKQIVYLKEHDEPTGLYNRRFFEQAAKKMDGEGAFPVSVIVGDIDGLKTVNDALGHSGGDALIAEVAGILKSCVRGGDILARTDGDEFCILLPRTGGEKAAGMVKKIYGACREHEKKGEIFYASISMGCATKTDGAALIGEIIREAEDNMARRKLLEHKSLHSSLIASIKTTLQEKSFMTEEHSERLSLLSFALGKALGLTGGQLFELELASALHDIGKIAVDGGILDKPDALTPAEWETMKQHPEVGYRIAMAVPELGRVAETVRCHHERWDGKGYPRGLKGESIPLLARILAVADSYDAMTSGRPYRTALSREDAAAEVTKNAGSQFDPTVALKFADILLGAMTEPETEQII